MQDPLFSERVHAFATVAAELYHFRYLRWEINTFSSPVLKKMGWGVGTSS